MSVQVSKNKPITRKRKRTLSFDKVSFFAVFLGLPLILYILFVVSPILQAFYYSLTDWGGYSNAQNFIGFQNYVTLFHDDLFWKSLRNNVVLAVCLPIFTITLALILATFVTIGGSDKTSMKGIRGSGFYRAVSFFPYAIPAVVVGILWSQMYSPINGPINKILGVFNDDWASIAWLGNKNLALGAIIAVIVWQFIGFYMLLFVAGIKNIPAEIYEAARIDGAGRLRTSLRITVPLLRDNISSAAVYLGIMGLDAFTFMAVLAPTGGPDNSALVVTQYLYKTAFTQGNFGLGIAMGVILALVTLAISISILILGRSKKGDELA